MKISFFSSEDSLEYFLSDRKEAIKIISVLLIDNKYSENKNNKNKRGS